MKSRETAIRSISETQSRDRQLDLVAVFIALALLLTLSSLVYFLTSSGITLPGLPLGDYFVRTLLVGLTLIMLLYVADQRRRLRAQVASALDTAEAARAELDTAVTLLTFSHEAAAVLGTRGVHGGLMHVLKCAAELYEVDAAALIGEDLDTAFVTDNELRPQAERALIHIALAAAGRAEPLMIESLGTAEGHAIAAPLRVNDELRFVLCMWNRDRKFPADQLHSLGLTGRMVELAIAKDELLEEVRSQLDGTLSVLQYLVADKRPDYSQHAMRVSRLAGDIARQMGMPTHTRKSLRLAGLIHDVGIMALPPDLAVSGQPLSIEAQLLIKQHPRIGSELANVANFNSDVQEAVGGHHERLDGSGYPDALRGDSIPPSARIMAVCEVFDSMTHRTYHSDSAEQSAVDELRTNAGRLYDSKVVSALLDCIAAQDLVADDLVLPELGTSAIDEPSAVGDDELIETDSTF